MIVAHETHQRDDATALFVIPNQSILFENIQDICETNYKKYKYAKHMIDLETKNWISSESDINSQIFCVTVDVAFDLIIRNSYSEFMKNLKYIVFDKVHL